MTKQTTTNAQEQHPAVLDAVPATALDGQTGTGPGGRQSRWVVEAGAV